MSLRVDGRVREQHETLIEFGRAAIPATRDLDLAELDRMRRERHAIEYEPGRTATPQQASRACAFAGRLLEVVLRRIAGGLEDRVGGGNHHRLHDLLDAGHDSDCARL